ncbi:MAG: SAM-dependent methyltransferase [Ruminococcaceae bacterium]|nr:SAM-dependent methyltransferase [Oscillospiraceae bacterium]
MWAAEHWQDFCLLDCSDGLRLERWKDYTLIRPDPQVIWKNMKKHPSWKRADGIYTRSKSGGGSWNENRLPEEWTVTYRDLTFSIKPMGFKHTGLFPEQAVNWDWFSSLIHAAGRPIKVLNLFAYTGGATVAAAKAGASVCHVDASKGMVARAKENAALSGLQQAPIRYIVDDCEKFCERELRRGNRYEGIIMDPPSYGRGPGGEKWMLEEQIDAFITLAAKLLSDRPLFFLVNSYTTGLSPSTMGYILRKTILPVHGGTVVSDEIGLPVEATGGILPCGSSSRWTAE